MPEIYSIFKECLQYTEDSYWINIFTDLSNGKMPYGIHITNENTITTHYKNKEFTYIFIDKDPKEVFDKIKDVLISDFGVFSQKDIKNTKKNLLHDLNIIEETRENNWKKIRRGRVQNFILHKYVIDYAIKKGKDLNFARHMKNTICAFLESKDITSDDIIMKSGKIKIINNITYNNKTEEFTVDEIRPKRVEKEKSIYMSDNWIKIIKKI